MAWYQNHYHCSDCDTDWEDEWSCCCDDECPACGAGDWSPVESDDLTEIALETPRGIVLMRSPASANDQPDYQEMALFESSIQADRYIQSGELI